jgi:hypothetical protein
VIALLLNLRQYHVMKPETPAPAAVGRRAGSQAPFNKKSKASKREARERARQDVIIGGAERVGTMPVNAAIAQTVAFFNELNLLVSAN